VLLTKADLSPDGAADRVREVEEMAPGTPVAAMALLAAERLPDLLAERLRAGHTLVLLGSSGVGKSTLLNRLAGRVLQRTASVRARDSRGRHTTSYRQMFPIAGGALVIDTPGLREIHLVETEVPASLEAVFPEIAAAGAGCRFRDCRHAGEPGCALPGAVTAGAVLAERLASYRRLRAEREGRGPGPSRRSRRPR
jgi:ribosome biogenesis GTPase